MRYPVPESARQLESATSVRNLLFIPLKNATGDTDLDYLSYGVPAMLFSSMHSGFLIEGRPLLKRRSTPVGTSIGKEESGDRQDVARPAAGRIFLKAALLDFRADAVRERQRGIPDGMSTIPAKEQAIRAGDPGQIALNHDAQWYVEGSVEFEPVPDPVYVDARGQRVVITAEVRKQLEGKELPRALAKILRDQRPSKVIVRMRLHTFERTTVPVQWEEEFRLRITSPYDGVDFAPAAQRLEAAIQKGNPALLRLRSVKSPGYAFLDDVFVGKTPLDLRAPAARMKLRIEQDGCVHYRAETAGVSGEFLATCEPNRGNAILAVTSEPSGAEVYLDHEFLGKTPLRREDLTAGVHRVRLSAKGHVDGFYGVELKAGHPVDVVATLKKGDTVAYYTDPGYAILDWTYDDLSFGLFLHSLAGYGGWRYARVRADGERDSIRGPLLTSFLPNASYGYYQYSLLEQARLRALTWERNGKAMAGVGIASLFAGGYYLYRALAHDERPFGELPDSSRAPQIYILPMASGRPGNGQMVGLALSFAF